MAEHTPGPWVVVSGPIGFNRVLIVSPSYRKECDAEHVICELRPWQRPDFGLDAQLLAAAPELLAALKRLLQCYEEYPSGQYHGNEVIADCKAAIAKAEGRSE